MENQLVDSLISKLAEATEEKEIHSLCLQLFARLKQARQRYDFSAMLNQKFYNGDQWIDANIQNFTLLPRTTGISDRVTVNLCEPTVRAHVSNFIRRKPEFVVMPIASDFNWNLDKGPTDPLTGEKLGDVDETEQEKAAKAAELYIQQVIEDNNFTVLSAEHLQGAFVNGHSYYKVGWDQGKNNLRGVVDIINIPFWNLYYDAQCRDSITFSDCRVIDHVTPADSYELSVRYKKGIGSDNKESPSQFDSSSRSSSNSSDSDTTLKHEMMVRIPVSRPLKVKQDDGTEIDGNGSYIDYEIRCYVFTEKEFLEFKGDPTGFNMMPYAGTYIYKSNSEPYAHGLLRPLRALQYQINLLFTRLTRIAKLMGQPLWYVPAGQKDNMVNTIGNVIEGAQGAEPKLLQGAAAPSSIIESLNISFMKFQDIGSVQDVMLGRMPPGVTSGAQVQVLLEANTASTGVWIATYEACLKHLAKLILMTAKNKYASEDLEPIELVTEGGIGGLQVYELDLQKLDFSNIKVSIEQGMTSTRSGQFEQDLRLFQVGAIRNRRALLKKLGYQNIDDLAKAEDALEDRMSELAHQSSQQQMQQQQLQPMPQPQSVPRVPQPQQALQ